jgi:hypothetical protein
MVELQIVLNKIYELRNQRVMLDFDLARLYEIETKILKRAVNRNIDRFPQDFMFQLTAKEFENLRYQIGTSSWGGTRYLPYAFTQEGVAMLSSVLRSSVAVNMNIAIMRAFVTMRQMITGYEELRNRIERLEINTDELYQILIEALSKKQLEEKPRNPIGFKTVSKK